MVDEPTIRKVADALLAATPPGSQVILFGSYARGQADSRSDLDFLVVEPEVQDLAAEMIYQRSQAVGARLHYLAGDDIAVDDHTAAGRESP